MVYNVAYNIMKKYCFSISFITLAFVIMATFNACKPEPELEQNTPGSVTVTTSSVSNITETSAKCGGTVTASGYSVGSCGLCYSELPNPTVNSYITSDQVGTGTFTSTMSGLEPGTKYYVRAYATTSSGTLYGEQKEFTTKGNNGEDDNGEDDNGEGDDDNGDNNGNGNDDDNEDNNNDNGNPTVTTSNVTNITATSARCGGNVVDSEYYVTEKGVCWSVSQNPTINDNHTNDGAYEGYFLSQMENLSPNTTYYVRAYAINAVGISYGEQREFTTKNGTAPIVSTPAVGKITSTTAACAGNIEDDGESEIIEKGVCWSTSQNPSINDNFTTEGAGKESFKSDMVGLSPNTIYYVRAYATNGIGTGYGEVLALLTSGWEDVISGYINNYSYVDLGLPSGVKWATNNIGATTSEELGNYYAWGETATKSTYTSSNSVTYNKYMNDISGDDQYDAARANWESSWRIPTKEETDELMEECRCVPTSKNGVNGYCFIANNGNYIFFPSAGYKDDETLEAYNIYGEYWTSTPLKLDESSRKYAYRLYLFNPKFRSVKHRARYLGLSIRPVSD